MKRIKFATALLLSILVLASTTTEGTPQTKWIQDFDTAKITARSEGKTIMMSFQGSDWCAACKRLDKSLFQSSEFIEFADSNLVLLQVDFPMNKANKLSKIQTEHNEKLAELYNPEGAFPKVIFFNASGEIIGTLEQPKEDITTYMKAIKALIK